MTQNKFRNAAGAAALIAEPAVFRLTSDGVVLSEVVPDIDLSRDGLDRMGFQPMLLEVPKLKLAAHLSPKPSARRE